MKPLFDTDTFREILDSILRNRSRSLLTGFGVFWGVFMLMLLTGGGQGLKDLLVQNFEGFAQNTCIVATSATTKPYKGFKKGRTWDLEYADVDRLKAMVPELETVSPSVSLWGKSVTRDENTSSRAVVKGARADYANIETPKIKYGRWLNDADNLQERKVCVIGKRVYEELFPEGGSPLGERISIDGSYYTVIGVDWRDSNGISINGSASDAVTIPINQARRAYNLGNTVHLLCFTAKEGITMSDVTPRVRDIIARQHYIDPTDEQAMFLLNTQLIFGIVDNLFKGINFLIWLIRRYRRVQHHDGVGEGAHHRDRHPPGHRRHPEPDPRADHLREHRPHPRGGHDRHRIQCPHPLRRGARDDHGRRPEGRLPGALRHRGPRRPPPHRPRRPRGPDARPPRHADQTRGRHA